MQEKEILLRQLTREKMARKEAESIAETKSRVLYQINVDLKTLSNDLIDKEKNTRAILEATADGIIVMDNQYNVILCNQASCKLFNYTIDELVGKNIATLINFSSLQNPNETPASVFLRQRKNTLYECTALRRNKVSLPVELAVSKIKLTQSSSIICIIRNIAKRKQAEQRLAMQHELVRIMAEHSSLDEITPKILKIMCETMHLNVGALWKIDTINNVLRCATTWTRDNSEVAEFAELSSKEMTFAPGIGIPGRVWENKSICWVIDVTKDSNFPRVKWAEKAGLRSAFALPILFEFKVLGVLEFFMKQVYEFDDNTIQLINDLSHQMGIFIEREQAQKRVLALSRLTGMSDVASSVLHNVGNTLNSMNTSIEMMNEKLNYSKLSKLAMITELCNEHAKDLSTFLTKDSIGKNIPEYLSLLTKEWQNENTHLFNEITLLKNNVQHIKHIIDMQQSFSGTEKVIENISLIEILEHSLIINELASKHADIKIICDFKPVKQALIDRLKLLQIILNLIKNGIDALSESTDNLKQLNLNLYEKDDDHFVIEVRDNGLGILPDNLIKIFSQGFTTKKSGHGHGLHSSALFAQQMGGTLIAQSKGIGYGATLTLILPYQPPTN